MTVRGFRCGGRGLDAFQQCGRKMAAARQVRDGALGMSRCIGARPNVAWGGKGYWQLLFPGP